MSGQNNFSATQYAHRVDSVIESSLREIIESKNFLLINLSISVIIIVITRAEVSIKEQSLCFPVGLICSFFGVSYYFIFFFSIFWLCGVGVFGLIEWSHSLPALHSGLQIMIINFCETTIYDNKVFLENLVAVH